MSKIDYRKFNIRSYPERPYVITLSIDKPYAFSYFLSEITHINVVFLCKILIITNIYIYIYRN